METENTSSSHHQVWLGKEGGGEKGGGGKGRGEEVMKISNFVT